MSILKMAEVWKLAKVEGGELLVLLALADFADDDGLCWPSVATIAEKSRLTERGTRGIIRRLEQKGFLSSEISRGGKGSSNRYYVMPNPEPPSGLTDSNPEPPSGLNLPNPEPDCIKPGTVVPPNLKRTINSKNGSRLSEDWALPQPWGTWALQQGLDDSEVRRQSEIFHDYWIGVPGQRGVKLDWQATWRNWIRSSKARGAFTNGGPSRRSEPRTISDDIMDDLKRKGLQSAGK